MLYSSCKNPLVDMVENNLHLEIEKKVTKMCILYKSLMYLKDLERRLFFVCFFTGLHRFSFLFIFQLEIDNGDELTSDFMYEEVHPKQHAHKQAFAKPKGPQGKRGGRRITRPAVEGQEED